MDLRPHHLLCTQGYSGKGYSDEFVKNMNQVTEKLRGSEPVTVHLTCSTDVLCADCPNMLGTDLCSTNEKVKRYDRKVMEYFQLEEMLADMCDGCSCYPVSACRDKILGKKIKAEG